MSAKSKRDRVKLNFVRTASLCLTGVCRNACTYCLTVEPVQEEGNLKPEAEIRELMDKAVEQGATRMVIVSGEWPDRDKRVLKEIKARGHGSYISYLEDLCRRSLELGMVPLLCVGYLFKEDLLRLRNYIGGILVVLESVERGVEEHRNAPGKDPKLRMNFMETAARLKIPVTTGVMVGRSIPVQRWHNAMTIIKNFQNEWGAVQELLIQCLITLDNDGEMSEAMDVESVMAAVREARRRFPGLRISIGWRAGLAMQSDLETNEGLLFSDLHDHHSLIFDSLPSSLLDAVKEVLSQNPILKKRFSFRERLPISVKLLNHGFYPQAVRSWVQRRLARKKSVAR